MRFKNILIILSILTIASWKSLYSSDSTLIGLPIKFVAGYEIDINMDGNLDVVFFFQQKKIYKLIALLNINENCQCYLLYESDQELIMTCHWGKEIKETDAGPGDRKGKVYKVNGPYILLTQPESFSVVFFWENGSFRQVCTSD